MKIVHVGLPDRTQTQYYEDQLNTLWHQGAIRGDAVFWVEGMPEWRPIAEFFPRSAAEASQPLIPMPGASGQIQPHYPQALNQQSQYQQPQYQQSSYQQSHRAASPAAGGIYAPRAEPVRFFVKDPTGLTNTLRALLWALGGFYGVQVIFEAVQAIVQSVQMANLSSTVTHPAGAPRPEDAMWSALAALLVAAIAICLFIIQVVMIVHLCKWIHRANANVRGFGAQGLNFTPGWAVGWFFVPLANLLLPYQAVVEIWKASRSPAHWQEAPIPNLVGVWWLLWLLFNATSVVMGYLAQNAVTIAEHRTATIVTIVVSLLAIGAITALVNVVSRIYRFQCDYVNGQP